MAQLWIDLFPWLTYALALVVLAHAWFRDGLFFALIPAVFAIYFLLSELAATQGALGYRYVVLPHLIEVQPAWVASLGQLVFGDPIAVSRPATCPEVPMAVPLAVPVVEALLVWSLLRTTLFLKAKWWLAPFMVGLVAVLLDVVLDPATAKSEWCGDPNKGLAVTANGLHFWRWYVWGHFAPAFHGIPLVNFGAWFFGSAAIALAAERVMNHYQIQPGQPLPLAIVAKTILIALVLILVVGFTVELAYFRWMHALFETLDAAGQWGFLIGVGVTTATAIVAVAGGLGRTAERRWELWAAPVLLIATNLVGVFASGPHAQLWLLVLAFVVTTPVVLLALWWPRRP